MVFATTSYSNHYKLISSAQWIKNMQKYDNIDDKNFDFLDTFIILIQVMTWVFLMQQYLKIHFLSSRFLVSC